jgi:potassium efflux system protein
MQRLYARAPRGWAVQLHAVWFLALVALPLAVGVLAAAGYFVAASYFVGRILASAFLAIGAVMLYGLMALWVRVQRGHLARRQDEEAARTKAAGAAEEARSEVAEAQLPQPAQIDVAMIGAQTRSLLDLFVTLLLLAGIWWVWREGLPVLSVIGDYALWSYSEIVDGKPVAHPLTVGHLLLAIVVGVVTAVVVRNVGALLDVVLLQRFEMQTDATYAIKVITRYAFALVGILLACDILGLRWNDVQWLVAALGVGLGFGLQEIVANFVSGLIVLAERPIRIGDVVTVGGISGTVARIRARATVVIDFDNKEVIIPNKAFITERVVNWTLSDQTTRLLIKVGVASGSDIALVQRIILDALRGNPDVVQDPAPSVYLVAFGVTLDFEIRAFVDSLDKRMRVQHEINIEVARALRENGIETK